MAFEQSEGTEASFGEEPRQSLWQRGVRSGDWLTWDRIGFACLCTAIGVSLGLVWLLLIPNTFGAPNGTVLMDYLSFLACRRPGPARHSGTCL